MSYTVFILIVLATVGFFNPMLMFSEQVQKLFFYLLFVVGFTQSFLKGRSLRDVNYPRVNYGIIVLFIALSAIVTTIIHRQSLMQSVTSVMPYLMGYAFFYVLMKSNVEKSQIIKFYLGVCVASSLTYFANLATFPNNIFGHAFEEDLSRGVLRVPIPFIEMFVLLLFYGINQVNLGNKKKWIGWIVFLSLMIVLSLTRQIILMAFVLGVWFFFKNVGWFKKVMFIVTVGGAVYFIVPQIPIFQSMMELTEEQQEENEDDEDVRIGAWRYFTYESQKGMVTPLFGNGFPALGISNWGKRIAQDREDNEYYPEDVGWAGFFWYFGIIATAALLVLLTRVTLKKKSEDEQYLTYWFIFIIVTAIASGPILYHYQVVSICVALYLVYKPKDEDSTDNIKLQQLSEHN